MSAPLLGAGRERQRACPPPDCRGSLTRPQVGEFGVATGPWHSSSPTGNQPSGSSRVTPVPNPVGVLCRQIYPGQSGPVKHLVHHRSQFGCDRRHASVRRRADPGAKDPSRMIQGDAAAHTADPWSHPSNGSRRRAVCLIRSHAPLIIHEHRSPAPTNPNPTRSCSLPSHPLTFPASVRCFSRVDFP